MATRKNTFLLKRSNVAGNIPTAGQIQLGELALNTADVKLYASGTTTNSILPIGWDRISRTGDTMTGTLYVPTISATTYQNLPLDIRVTGGTYAGGVATFTNNTGGTFTVNGFSTGSSTGLTPSDYVVQGKLNADQTIPSNVDTIIQFIDDVDPQGWLNSSNYRFTPTIAGYYNVTVEVLFSNGTVTNNQYNTQMRKNGNQIAIFQNQITTSVGVSQGNSRVVYLNGTTDYVDFTVFNGNTGPVNISKASVDSSGTYFSANLLVGGNLLFTGGTISGPANAIAGFSANTISATTYYNLPTDVRVTGGTYNAGTATFTNNTGGTFNVTGLATPFTGGTVAGPTIFTGGLSANTVSATTYYNLPNDLPVSGTAGQILAKIDGTNYNVEWIDNYANWTSQLKHEVKAGEAINKGQAVYVSSANGTNMIVSKASNTSEATSSKTLGLLAQDLANNGQGFVITEGLLAGLNTGTANAGDAVWLGTNGNLIFGLLNKPVAPAHLVYIGVVTRAQTVNGEIFVRPQNGFEFNELHDVLLTGVTNGDLVSYDSSTSLWKNSKTLNGVYSVNGSLSATTMSAVTFTGNLTGTASLATSATTALNSTNASAVAVTNNTSTNSTYYLGFVGGTSGNHGVQVDSSTLTFNPSTNTLTVANVSGLASLATSATTAFSASNATNATLVNITEFSTAPVDYNITFVGAVSGNNSLGVDSTTLTYRPGTSTLTVPFINGLASLATSATTALNSDLLDGQHGSYYYPASNPNGYTTNTGTVTGVNSGNGMNFSNFTTSGTITMGTPSSLTLSSTNATTTNSHTHAFAPGGTTAQYITGAGTLVTFPTITTVNDGTLSMSTSGIATGSATFTANQSGNTTFTVSVPATDLTIGSNTSTVVRVDSSTGTDATLPVATASLAGVLVSADWTTFNNKQPQLSGTGFVKAVGTTISYDNSTYYLASNPNGYTTNTGTVTGVNKGNGMDFTNFTTSGTITLGTPSSTTLSSTNAVTSTSHTHAFAPGGTTAQYITGAGTLVTFPTIPTVNDGTLTLATSGIATGSASFTANQAGASTFTVSVPATNLSIGVSSGTQVRMDSSTGTDIDIPVASATLAGIVTNSTQTFGGVKTFNSQINGTVGSFTQSAAGTTLYGYNGGTGSVGVSGGAGDGVSGYFVNNSSTYPVLRLLGLSNTRLLEGRDTSDVIRSAIWSNGDISGTSFIRTGGTSAQFLKANGSVDSTTYVPTSRTLTINGTAFDLSTNRSWTISAGTGTVTQVNSGNGMNFSNFTTTGTITMGTPSSLTLSSTNSVTTNSHTHAFAPGGTTGQYITGAGTLVTFPTIPTVNDGTLTLATSGIATGSASFTANQGGASTFTVNVPATDLSIGSNTGTVVRVDSSTGTDATLPVATASLAGVVTNTTQTFGGVKTFNDEVVIENSTFESQGTVSFGVGGTVVYSRTVTTQTAFFFDYVVTSGANARAGSLMVVINGSSIEFNETSTNDIGNTSAVTLVPSIGGGILRITANSTSGTWTFKSVTRIL